VLVLGPVARFPTSKHVVSYIGLAPAVHASAEKCRLGHVTKQGNALLRYVLGQAGQVATRGDADLRRLFLAVMHRAGQGQGGDGAETARPSLHHVAGPD
jgi:transposase